jgi:hypothetical protein
MGGSGATPVPAKLTVCGLPAALSATLIDALSEPTSDGVKLTLMLQLLPAPRDEPQVFV